MAHVTRIGSAARQPRARPPEVSWQNINAPGAYVELGTGDLYRIPKEALVRGTSPLIRKESSGALSLMLVSRNPYVTTAEARTICADHNIAPNF